MSVETDMEAFLPGDLFTRVGTALAVLANDIYFDSYSRYKRSGTEILCSFAGEPHVSLETGDLITFAFNMELFKAIEDSIQGITDVARVERYMNDAAKIILRAYHGEVDVFMASGSLNVLVDSVVCQRSGPVIWESPDIDDPRIKATLNISLEILAYEEPS